MPIAVGYFTVAFAFGIFAVKMGLTSLEALFISMFNVTSAGQLAAVPIMTAGGSLFELAASQFIINLRYALMSISLSQRFDGSINLADRFLIAFVNTDEVFGVASRYETVNKTYMFGLILTPFLGWSLGTFIGAVAGSILPAVVITSLSVAIYGMFIAIVLPVAKGEKAMAVCVLIAVSLSCAFYFIPLLKSVPSGFSVIICSVVASVIMAIVRPIDNESGE